jgi:hypothetical protein
VATAGLLTCATCNCRLRVHFCVHFLRSVSLRIAHWRCKPAQFWVIYVHTSTFWHFEVHLSPQSGNLGPVLGSVLGPEVAHQRIFMTCTALAADFRRTEVSFCLSAPFLGSVLGPDDRLWAHPRFYSAHQHFFDQAALA